MARPTSVLVGGYFPTPNPLLPALASLVRFTPSQRGRFVLVDPCAADGAAIAALRSLWLPRGFIDAEIQAVELEKERALQQRAHLHPSDVSLHGDAFHVEITAADGASLLFLNPPYDHDKSYGRLEQRFLKRWTSCLLPAHGVLLFVVPYYALKASAAYLAEHYTDIRAWRFPGASFEAFRQCVVAARRRLEPVPDNPVGQRLIELWASGERALPELEVLSEPRYTAVDRGACLTLKPIPLDIEDVLGGFRLWHRSAFAGLNRSIADLVGAKFPVAQPPRPAHLALALSAGPLSGKILSPDSPGLPHVLVKGVFERVYHSHEERFNSDGEHVGTVMVQKPRLRLSILRLDTLEFHELRPGSAPTGATDLADFTSADLVASYLGSLTQHMRVQFPALHDPADPSHDMRLPVLARTPLTVQRNAIIAGLKVIALGQNPQALAEVGTGKTTVSLSIVGALSPAHFDQTRSELKRLGFNTSRLPKVRRTLVLCPPHLLHSWRDQAAAVLPGYKVVVVESIADLDLDASLYLLSHETAKLGHALRGVRGPRCPRCGARLEATSSTLAATRARCDAVVRIPENEEARLAEDLAAAIATTFPYSPRVRNLVSRHRILFSQLPEDVDGSDAGDDLEAAPSSDAGASAPLPTGHAHRLAQRIATIARRLGALLGADGPQNIDPQMRDAFVTLATASSEAPALADHLAEYAHRLEATAQSTDRAATLRRRRRAGQLHSIADTLRLPATGNDQGQALLDALEGLCKNGRWRKSPPCGEPLFQAVPQPRRYPLANYILRRRRSQFDLFIPDEWHKYSTRGSAQQKAAHRLAELPGVPTIALTGTYSGGYASSVFAPSWALSDSFREEFRFRELQAFISAYGFRKVFVSAGSEDRVEEIIRYGTVTDREEGDEPLVRQLGQAPGILPIFILRHVLPTALIMQKADLDEALPACEELPRPITIPNNDPYGQELLDEYKRLLDTLTHQIKTDRFTRYAGKLWGAMLELPSYLDRCTADLDPFVLSYPQSVGGFAVATAKMFPASWITPKERCILDTVRQSLMDQCNVLLFLRHTGSGLPGRYQRLFRRVLGEQAVLLDPTTVRPAIRETWLNDNVVRPGRRILITHPKAVETGLNNLVHFSTGIWVEGPDYDARIVRQANGRLHRIGQLSDVEIHVPYYQKTLQETAFWLVARKLSASEVFDALSLESALESAGSSDGNFEDTLAAMSLGQALYTAWASSSELR